MAHDFGDREADHLVESMVSGFLQDPLYVWLYPDARSRPELLRPSFSLVLRAGLERGTVDHSADLGAVAIWTPPGTQLLDDDEMAYWQTLLKRDAPGRFGSAIAGMAACAEMVPSVPHWTLHSIVVAAERQNCGVGSTLLRRGLERVDEAGGAAHLESSNARNVSVYERHGFHVVGEVPLDQGPTIRPMSRAPR